MITLDDFTEQAMSVDELEEKIISMELLEYIEKYGDDGFTEIIKIEPNFYAHNGLVTISIETDDNCFDCYIKQEDYTREYK